MIATEPAKELVLPAKEVVEAMADQRNDAQKAAKSCADWNALLCWAREERGPQFDSSTGLYMVDKASYEGTAYVEPVPCVRLPSGRSDGRRKTEDQLERDNYLPERSTRAQQPDDPRILRGDAYARAFSSDEDEAPACPSPRRRSI